MQNTNGDQRESRQTHPSTHEPTLRALFVELLANRVVQA